MKNFPKGGTWKSPQDLDLKETRLSLAKKGELKSESGAGTMSGLCDTKGRFFAFLSRMLFGGCMYYVFENDVIIDGNLDLDFDYYVPDEDELEKFLKRKKMDSDDAYFLFLGNLEVKGSIRGSVEDPHFQLLVEGDLHTRVLAANDGAVMGSVYCDYQFVDNGADLRCAGVVHAQALILESQASVLNPLSEDTVIFGGELGLPIHEHVIPEFQFEDPQYAIQQAAIEGRTFLRTPQTTQK